MERIEISEFSGSGVEWEGAVTALDPGAALQNRFAYGAIAAGQGRAVRRFVLRRQGETVGLAQVVGRGGLWLLARGPVFAATLPDTARRAALRAVARAVPGLCLATPEAPLAGFGLVPLITARHHAIWDISGPEGALRTALQGKWRNRLVAAEKAGLRAVAEADPGWILATEAAQRESRGYRGLPAAFVQAWARAEAAAETGGVLALTARDAGGTRLAGVVALCAGPHASYHLGVTTPEGRALGAHNFLLWNMALRLRALGVRSLDLGDIDSVAGAGRMRFKLGTGAVARPLGASCLVLPSLRGPS